MKKLHRYWILGFALVFGLVACNMPSASSSEELPLESQAGTLAAQTVAASITEAPTETQAPANTPTKLPPTETFTPVESPTPEASPTPKESPTPTQTPRPLTAPSLKTYDYYCTWNGANTELQVSIKWTDQSDNELGFIVYRNGAEVANLLPNTTSYDEVIAVTSGVATPYTIKAYNNVSGTSGAISFSVTCD